MASVISNLVAAQYPGFNRRLNYTTDTEIAQASSANTVVVEGPPATGYVRHYRAMWRMPATATTVTVLTTHQPSGLVLFGPGSNANFAVTSQAGPIGCVALKNGESIEFVNTAGADAVIGYSYRDYPDPSNVYTTGCVGLSGTDKVEVIPAAPSGMFSRIASFGCGPIGGSLNSVVRPAWYMYNDDTAAHNPEAFLGDDSVPFSRGSQVSANLVTNNPAPGATSDLEVTTDALKYALRAAVTTPGRTVTLLYCYETLPLP